MSDVSMAVVGTSRGMLTDDLGTVDSWSMNLLGM